MASLQLRIRVHQSAVSGSREEGLGCTQQVGIPIAPGAEILSLLDLFPSTPECFRPGTRRPQRLKECHGDAPMGHPALGIGPYDPLECSARLFVLHVVKKGQGMIEFLGRAGGIEG